MDRLGIHHAFNRDDDVRRRGWAMLTAT